MSFVLGLLLIIIFLVIYFLPWIVASERNHKNEAGIAILNLLTGWTIAGWIAALIWSTTYQETEGKKKHGN